MGKLNPLREEYCYFSFLPETSKAWTQTLEGLFELNGALQGPSLRVLLPELQRYKEAARSFALGAKVPGP